MTAEEYYNLGLEYLQKYEFNEAIVAFARAEQYSFESNFPEASFARGFALYSLGRDEEAIEAFIKAEQDGPDGKFPYASYNKGLSLYELKLHEEAISAYTKAEQDSADGKFFDASYARGISLAELKRYDEAISAYTKAEQDSPDGKFPNASSNKGTSLSELKRYEESISAYIKAEQDSPGGKFPRASKNRGLSLNELNRYEEAISAYTQAEQDSPDGKFPDASKNRGISLDELKCYEEAISAYTKAEQDSPDGKFPNASKNRGISLAELKCNEEAVSAYTKAEQDSPDGKFPDASYNKGVSLAELQRYEESVSAYLKAEQDSPNGKFPQASNNRGTSLHELGRNEEAVSAYLKAEQDSPDGKLPDASKNRGLSLYELGEYEMAVEAYFKAEQDTPDGKFPVVSNNKGTALSELGLKDEAIRAYIKAETDSVNCKFPIASCNKGAVYQDLNQNFSAIVAYQKAINDSESNFFPEAHLRLAKIYLKANIEKSSFHAFQAISQDNRNTSIVSFVCDHFSTDNTKPIYENRLAYLDESLWQDFIKGTLKKNQDVLDQLEKIIEREPTPDREDLDSFLMLLKNKELSFQESISYIDRLRLCYLLHFNNREYGKTFYLIDKVLDNAELFPNGLDSMDFYFYMCSAIFIGESPDDLNYFITVDRKGNDFFSKAYNEKSKELSSILSLNLSADPYLVDHTQIQFFPISFDPESCTYHRWIKQAVQAINGEREFTIPYGHAYVTGIFAKILHGRNRANDDDLKDKKEWLALKNALSKIKAQPARYAVGCIRDAIKNSVPFAAILDLLITRYSLTKDENKKREIIILQAAAILSNEYDLHRRTRIKSHHVEIPVSSFAEKGIGLGLANLFDLNFLMEFLTSSVSGFLIKGLYEIIKNTIIKTKENKVDSIFEMIEAELKLVPE